MGRSPANGGKLSSIFSGCELESNNYISYLFKKDDFPLLS